MKRLTADQWMGIVLGLMAITVLGLSLWEVAGNVDAVAPIGGGDPMPEVRVRSLAGEPLVYPAGDSKGQVLLLDFWATWCGPCRETLPTLEKLHRDFEGQITLLSINTEYSPQLDKQAAMIRRFLEDAGLDLPVVIDDRGFTQIAYRVQSLPTLYLIGKDGRVREVWVGVTGYRRLKSAIEEALSAPAS
ncbi:MAG: TlpA family protein disulfide reductase [Deltaproteobacteria bacterium]|nr:MAG: TlpA family protein disulfide reductase [Deltaproteobacteria bacterium]